MGDTQRKEMRTAEELVSHMKRKGVSFRRRDEASAALFLKTKNNYFRVSAFRKLFPKYVGGENDGRYISLDFDDLVQLSYVDQSLRSTLRAMSLDVEHYEKVAILNRIAEDAGEDGYSIVADYKESLTGRRLSHLEAELSARSHDIYCGSVISKYREDMPVWALLEVASFGTFVDFCRFCSERWGDEDLRDLYYMLLKAKSIRNAASHGACIVNGFSESDGRHHKTPRKVQNALGVAGVPKSRRNRWLDNPRMRDIATLIYLYSTRVEAGSAKEGTMKRLASLYEESEQRIGCLPSNNPAVAGMSFMRSLTNAFLLG
ncbi:MAG: Abi family protein [Coriobacteriales bacterium]